MPDRRQSRRAPPDAIAAFCGRHGLSHDAVHELRALLEASAPTGTELIRGSAPMLDLDGARERLVTRESHEDGEPGSVAMGPIWSSSSSLPTMFATLSGLGDDPALEEAEAAAATVRGPEVGVAARYVDLGVIGRGGMGEVRRVQDRDLNRVLAMKVIRPEALHDATQVSRFIQEAQVIAQLDHPGVVPAYELGRLPDGRLYFTMKEVKGRTLANVIGEVHAASTRGRWRTSRSGWTFWRLIDAFCTVCKAMAYAHACGVVHRDLKPANVMVGAFGEVLVMDWGLAKVLGQRDIVAESAPRKALKVKRADGTSGETLHGSVSGTPNYMPPEQARGEIDRLGPPSDVYALGAILYEILCGWAPYRGEDAAMVLKQVMAGPPPPPPRVVRGSARGTGSEGARSSFPPVPEALWEICQKAMSQAMEDRYPHAGALADEVSAWLEGDKERGRAREIVLRAESLLPGISALRAEVEALRTRAAAVLEPIRPYDPVEVKRPGWALIDQAARLERDADLREIEHVQLLQAALAHVPDLPEAHARLADHYRAGHEEAEARRDWQQAARLEAMLRTHDDGRYAGYLKGEGHVTVVSDPPGATVSLYRFQEQDRRLVPVYERGLGKTPLYDVPMARGSYLLVLRAEGRQEVRYPVAIERQERWTSIAPTSEQPLEIHLPPLGSLGADDVYVPGGWARVGGDPQVVGNPGQRVWVDPFVIRRFPVTNREYIAFLDDLLAQGRERDALRWAPRERSGSLDEEGALLYGRDDDGRFVLRADSDGDLWLPDWPVVNIDWESASAFAAWLAARTERPWRLPRELEWEKAARGVDGRFFPWGDFLDPTWCRMRDSLPGRAALAVVDSYPVDESPYGVRGLAGNTRDWCLDAWRPDGPQVWRESAIIDPDAERVVRADMRAFRGGAFNNPASSCRSAYRSAFRPHFRYPVLGMRVARSL